MSTARTLVLTGYDSAMAPIGDLTAPLMLQYANRHGYDFHCTRCFDDSQSYWQKLWDIQTFMTRVNPIRKGFKRILWLDADQVITNPNWTPPWMSGFHASLDWGDDAVTDIQFSMCGFVICDDMEPVIAQAVQLYDEYRDRDFPEQACFRSIKENAPKWIRNAFHTHGRRVFNAVPKDLTPGVVEPWQRGDFCAHITHLPVENRVNWFHEISRQAA